MKKEEFLEKLGDDEDAENGSLIYDLVEAMVNELENKIMSVVRKDIQQLDRGISVLEDRFDSLQNRVDNISYTLKKALQVQA